VRVKQINQFAIFLLVGQRRRGKCLCISLFQICCFVNPQFVKREATSFKSENFIFTKSGIPNLVCHYITTPFGFVAQSFSIVIFKQLHQVSSLLICIGTITALNYGRTCCQLILSIQDITINME